MNKQLIFKPAVYWGTALYILLSFSVLGLGDKVASHAFPEDRYFENVGAVAFFAASIIFFSCFVYARKPYLAGKVSRVKRLAYLGLSCVFFFGGGEEISWGQRIFNIQTPDALNALNVQGETNVHNIALFEYNIPFETVFSLFWLVLVVLIPVASMVFKNLERLLPIVHWGVGLLFFFDYFLAKGAKIVFKAAYTYEKIVFKQAVQEIKESNYALLFAFFALFVFLDLKKFGHESARE